MPSWATGDSSSSAVRPAYAGASAGDLGPDALDRLETEIGVESAGQLGRDDPVGAGGAGAGDLLVHHADPPLDVGRGASTSAKPAVGSTMSAWRTLAVGN